MSAKTNTDSASGVVRGFKDPMTEEQFRMVMFMLGFERQVRSSISIAYIRMPDFDLWENVHDREYTLYDSPNSRTKPEKGLQKKYLYGRRAEIINFIIENTK
jgi:hypothetical protein